MAKKLTPEQQEEIKLDIAWLKKRIQPGETIYFYYTNVTPSGTTRYTQFFAVSNNHPFRLTWRIANVTGRAYNKNYEAATVRGEYPNDVIESLSYTLFGDYDSLRWEKI
jgi:hypothetical protein